MASVLSRAMLLCLTFDGTRAAVQCQDYVRKGYCQDPKYQKYLSRHCPDACAAGATEAVQEDEACVNWAAEGYCTHPQFVEYMERSCPTSCGFPPAASGGDAAAGAADATPSSDEDAAVEDVAEEDEEEAAAPPPTSRPAGGGGGGGGGDVAAAAAGEPEHCAAWARQGLCDAGSQHHDYMSQNCAATCESVPAGGGGAAAAASDPMTCARWAMSGFCAEGHQHATYMHTSCKDACEKAAKLEDAKAPPFDIFVILMLIGFGYAVVRGVKYAIERDGALCPDVKHKTLGVERTVGMGTPNKSALYQDPRQSKTLGAKKRSAKKA